MYNFKGINDEHDTCECCGRTNLKRVVWLAPADQDGNDTGDAIPHGTQCAAKVLGYGNLSKANVDRKFITMQSEQRKANRKHILDTECKFWNNVYILKDEDLAEISAIVGLVPNRMQKMAMIAKQRRIAKYPESA